MQSINVCEPHLINSTLYLIYVFDKVVIEH